MSDFSEDPFRSIYNKSLPEKNEQNFEIHASSLEGKIVQNLKLLKSLIRGEKVRLNQFIQKELSSEEKKKSAIDQLQKKIIDEFLELNLQKLAQIEIPKKLHEECFDLLVQTWRRKIQKEYSQTLTFSALRFSKDSIRAFVVALSLSVSLKALRLDQCNLGPFEMKLLAVFIRVHPTIQILYLDKNPIQDEGFSILAQALKQNQTLLHLSFNKMNLSDASFELLKELIEKMNYRSLSLKDNSFSDEIKEKLIEASFRRENFELNLD